LVDVNKKSISENIRRNNRKKKLQHESANQDSTTDTAYVSEMVNNDKKSYEPEINEITNCSSSELSHKIEVVASQSIIVDTPQGEILMVDSKVAHDIKPRFSENSELSHDKKPVNIVNRFSENLKLLYERKTVTNTSPTFFSEIETERLKKEDSSVVNG